MVYNHDVIDIQYDIQIVFETIRTHHSFHPKVFKAKMVYYSLQTIVLEKKGGISHQPRDIPLAKGNNDLFPFVVFLS